MDYAKESLKMHYELKGKIEVVSRAKVDSKDALSLAYTPGVAQPCLEIQKDINKSYELTRRWNTVAVVTDGTAVLGLGDIGPEAGMPVMEGKCVLFKEFGDVDAIPLCVRSKDVDEIVQTVRLLAGSFGGVNLEDISAPRCFEIEKKLKECCDIPIFHDDQHGTAVITLAAAAPEEIETIVKPCGLGKSKARDISACMKILHEKYHGNVPCDFNALLALPGVGRKSANLIMGDVFGKPAIVTDTHCIRLTNRIGLVEGTKDPKKVEMALWKIIPPEEGNDFCHRLVNHGREICTARTKPYCDRCCLADICAKNGVN